MRNVPPRGHITKPRFRMGCAFNAYDPQQGTQFRSSSIHFRTASPLLILLRLAQLPLPEEPMPPRTSIPDDLNEHFYILGRSGYRQKQSAETTGPGRCCTRFRIVFYRPHWIDCRRTGQRPVAPSRDIHVKAQRQCVIGPRPLARTRDAMASDDASERDPSVPDYRWPCRSLYRQRTSSILMQPMWTSNRHQSTLQCCTGRPGQDRLRYSPDV